MRNSFLVVVGHQPSRLPRGGDAAGRKALGVRWLRNRLRLIGIAAFMLFQADWAHAETLVRGDCSAGNCDYRPVPSDDALVVEKFNIPFARLDAVTIRWFGSAEATASCRNSSSFQAFVNINGQATATAPVPGWPIDAVLRMFPSGSTTIGPNRTGNVFGFDNDTLLISIPSSELFRYSGAGSIEFPVAMRGNPPSVTGGVTVNSRDLLAFASVEITYTYTPIGATQEDPILPQSTSGGSLNFSSVPSNRWFDPPTAAGYRFETTSAGDAFTAVTDFPTGFDGPFFVRANELVGGPYTAGNASEFPGPVTSFSIFGLRPLVDGADPRAFPIRLAFNRDGVSFRMTPQTSCQGDTNGDRNVDLEDLSALLRSFGRTDGALLVDGDLTGDRMVDLQDLSTLLAVFGAVCAP